MVLFLDAWIGIRLWRLPADPADGNRIDAYLVRASILETAWTMASASIGFWPLKG